MRFDSRCRGWNSLARSSKLEAQFVLHPLLARDDLGAHAADSVQFAVDWVKQFGGTIDAGFVFPAAGARRLGAHVADSVQFAVDWLKQFGGTIDAGFVLPPLLAHDDLGTHGADAVNLALTWLKDYPDTTDAGYS